MKKNTIKKNNNEKEFNNYLKSKNRNYNIENNFDTIKTKNQNFKFNEFLKPFLHSHREIKTDYLIKKKINEYRKEFKRDIFSEDKIHKNKRKEILDDKIPSHHKTEIYYYYNKKDYNNKTFSFMEEFKFKKKEKINYQRKDNLLKRNLKNNLIMPSNPFNLSERKNNIF